jgi:hypothetical protein
MFQLNPARATLLVTVLALLFSACHTKPKLDPKAATRETFTQGMLAYLSARGELCLGKEFPLDVTEREMQVRARNAVQMPALEHLGLVTSENAMGEVTTEDGPLAVPVTRFQLTDTGKQYYRSNSAAGEGTNAGQGSKPHGDLCVAKLTLDKVVSWELSPTTNPNSAVVSYTYHVQAAPWTSAPEVKAVFPAVERVILGAESALLKEGFTLTKDGWVANELVPPDAPQLAQNGAH